MNDTSPRHPESLARLVARARPELEEGVVTRDMAALSVPDPVDALLKLLLDGLTPLRGELDALRGVVLAKMKKVRRLTLIGAVVAALSGLIMAITSALGIGESLDKVVTAALASIGGLIVVFSDYFQTAPNGRKIASSEEYGKLEQISAELLLIQRRADRHPAMPLSAQEIEQMIDQTDSYAAHIIMLQD
ncbi:MAG: hypothetical protein AAGP08_13515 [Pseudomonadota bacterium]